MLILYFSVNNPVNMSNNCRTELFYDFGEGLYFTEKINSLFPRALPHFCVLKVFAFGLKGVEV